MRFKNGVIAAVVMAALALAFGVGTGRALSVPRRAAPSPEDSVTVLAATTPDTVPSSDPSTSTTPSTGLMATTTVPSTTSTTTVPVTSATTVPTPPPTAAPPPGRPARIRSLRASPRTIPYTGGFSVLTVRVVRARTCRVSSPDHVRGLPLTTRCVRRARLRLRVVRNRHHHNEVVVIRVVASGPHGKSQVHHVTVTVLGAPLPPPPPRTTTTTTTRPPPPAPPTTTARPSCSPRTAGGNCYEPGELCPAADHGLSGIAGDGKRITCEDNDGWRWEPS
jgi:hypothetical protein